MSATTSGHTDLLGWLCQHAARSEFFDRMLHLLKHDALTGAQREAVLKARARMLAREIRRTPELAPTLPHRAGD